ncbi:MAG: DUF3341 domain-containing protein [Sumerlaeia bacterium]
MGTLPKHSLVGFFNDPDELMHAAAQARSEGFQHLDAYTPFPIHGIEEVLGLDEERSGRFPIPPVPFTKFKGVGFHLQRYRRIPQLALTALCIGALGGFVLQWWTHGYDWPINVGGRPEGIGAWPAYIVITFESGILLAGLTTFFSLFAFTKLFPNPFVKTLDPDLTNDRFALVIPVDPENEDYETEAAKLLQRMGADEILKVD